ncbi:MAG: UDP-N-acetylglucosamine 2-epimerase (hydrolyzing) [Labilithrix sp.]|nr:UDP-N-acetylglucosamine 2-epimerase (hydrolyzing) [Labilithrix sp.]MCW5814733.1 UDP-N-acetylglucosamine 2-epimerase (hydrolyzing) [Labilithrix sp.]
MFTVLTTGRQDWGILRSTCRHLRAAGTPARIVAGGMALSSFHGASARLMEEDGFPPAARLPWIEDGRSIHEEAAVALRLVGEELAAHPPAALLLVGDRFETISAAVAATLHLVPVVHLHGGEETEGAFDNALRHAITKLAHLHLVAHPRYAARVLAMGEDPATVHVVGAPGLDNLNRDDLPDRAALEERLGITLEPPVVIVTLHPTTLGASDLELRSLLEAMDATPATYVITLPNNDPGAAAIRSALRAAAEKPRRAAAEALGERFYWSLLREADAILGNSSSAIIEAPAVALPAVNVGTRQGGRVRAPNVLDAPPDATAVCAALARALDPAFRASIAAASKATFGDGHAAERIVDILRAWRPPRPPIKRHRLEGAS